MPTTETAEGGRRAANGKAHAFQRRADNRQNGILACMPDRDFARLERSFESVSVQAGQALFPLGEQPSHALFPVDAVVSLSAELRDGTRMALASVGSEGMVGVFALMGGRSACSCAVAQRAGRLLRLPTQKLQVLFDRGGASQRLFLRYTHFLLVEMGQLAACNRLHSLHQRLCRWLLLHHDITPHSELLQSQDSISDALGVRREGVTASANRLRDEGAIRYNRGRITVLNKERLGANACECYGRLRKERERLLPRKVAT